MDTNNITDVMLRFMSIEPDNSSYNVTLPDDVMDTDAPRLIDSADIYFLMGMLSVFAVIGTLGNALIIYIFAKMLKQNLTSTIFILTLGGTDLFTCCITIPSTIAMEYYHEVTVYDIPCKIYTFLMTTTVPYSSFIMVAISVDRYLCICRPFLHAMNIHRAKITVISLACALFPFGLIISLFYGVYQIREPSIIECLSDLSNESYSWNSTRLNMSEGWNAINESMVYMNSSGLYLNSTCATPSYTEYTGKCKSNSLIFPRKMMTVFQYMQMSFFVIAIVIVFVLYGAILRRVLAQNKSRGGTKLFNNCCSNSSKSETRLAPLNGEATFSAENVGSNGDQTQSLRLKGARGRRGSKKGDKLLVANLKIAGTLFTVTLVFLVAFLPAWLMALDIIDFEIRLFYSYFVYNIANPVIYAFLNPSFRQQLKQLFPCGRKRTKTRSTLSTTVI